MSRLHQEADSRENAVQQLGKVDGEDIWRRLGRYWSRIDAELDPTTSSTLSEDTIIDLGTMLAKLERNLIAGLGSHQEKALYVYQALGWSRLTGQRARAIDTKSDLSHHDFYPYRGFKMYVLPKDIADPSLSSAGHDDSTSIQPNLSE